MLSQSVMVMLDDRHIKIAAEDLVPGDVVLKFASMTGKYLIVAM